jgi:hypothetical protein
VLVVDITKNNSKILFVGCSLTAESGFTQENQSKYHWPWLLASHYNYSFQNAALNGMSNEEIFYRTTEILTNNQFDLVVVMWSEIGRKWVYFENNNVDDYTIMNKAPITGNFPHKNIVQDYAKLHYTYFDNQYINLKNWLLQIIALENFCKINNQPYVFAKGFENHINDFLKVDFKENGFINIEPLKYMLDFDNRSDSYVKEKIQIIKNLITKIDKTNWINFDSDAFLSDNYSIDLSDDHAHPGTDSNLKIALDFISHCKKKNIINVKSI